jgi:hypothetical protein
MRNVWVTRLVGLALGAVFVVAAIPKIVDPPSFAHMIYNYRLLPGLLVNPAALALPWLELFTGIALVAGFWRRTVATIAGALLLAFVLAIGVNLARRNAVQCGCFDVHAKNQTREEKLVDMRWVLMRDLGLGLLVAQQIAATRRAAIKSA